MSLSTINKITVLGSGVMGHGIAQVSAMAGYSIILRDIEQSFLDKAMEKIRWSLNKLVEKQKLSQGDADAIFARITPKVDLKDALRDADLLIEAVPEDMNLPGFRFHGLNTVPKRWSIAVSGNYRITFGWDGADAVDADIEDYH